MASDNRECHNAPMTIEAPPALSPARRYRGAGADERRAQRRCQLVAAAIEVYGERGFQTSTVKAVCDAAGLTERYFYESFPNSEALLAACFETVTEGLFHDIAHAGEVAREGGRERALAMLHAYFAALQCEPRSARVFLLEIRGVSKLVDAALDTALQSFGSLLVRALLPAGQAPDPLLLAGVTGGIMHVALRWIRDGYTPTVDAVAATALQLAITLTDRH